MSTQIQNFYEATITRNWNATTGDLNVSVLPTISEGIIVISPSSRTLREIVRFTATGTNAYGAYITVSNIAHRGLGGTTAQSHTIGEKVRMNITAEHWTEMQADIDAIIAGDFVPVGTVGQTIVSNGTNWVAGEGINEDQLKVATISLSSADILALHTTPKELLPAPGAGKIIILESLVFSLTAGIAYVNGDNLSAYYKGDTSVQISSISNSTVVNSATNIVVARTISVTTINTAGINKALELKPTSATAFITGTGTAKIFIKYRILSL